MITREDLNEKLEPYWAERPVSKSVDTGEGWYDLIAKLLDDITAISKDFKIMQIKEKFGGLRFYIVAPGSVLKANLIKEKIYIAEDLSLKTCEVCGEPGEPRRVNGWIRTLCDAHSEVG